MTFNIKEEIVKKLLEYNPSINYKRLKYIVSNKYNLLQGNNKLGKQFFNDMIEIEESVNYINESLRIRADKAEINLLSKKLNISMKNDKDKIFINGQY